MPRMALSLTFFTLLVLFPLTAYSAERATWKAEMSEVAKDGSPIATLVATQHTLVMNQNGDRVSSFDFTDGTLLPSPAPKPATTRYRVIAKVDIGCGSKLFLALSGKTSLLLSDHRMRTCDDVVPAIWDVQVRGIKHSKRYFRGAPSAISKYAACDSLGQMMCTQVYMPTSCTLSSVEGKPIDPAITVNASNSCFASIAMKSAMCGRGLNPDALEKSDVVCSISSPPVCPLPMCAAPPEGCSITSSSELNADGCPVYPCGILSCPSN